MRVREKTMTILFVLSLFANVFLLAVALVPGDDIPALFPPDAGPSPAATMASLPGIGRTASMQAPVTLQKVEITGIGPFSTNRMIEEGAMVNISVEIVPGRGRVLVQTTPLMGIVFQDAANRAVDLAAGRSHADLAGSDIIFSIQSPDGVSEIDGPSAGALMTVLLLSVMEDFALNESVTVTGTIDENGNIGPVGGILEKAGAAAASGKTLLLLPAENNNIVESREETGIFCGLRIVQQRPVVVDTGMYIEERYGIRVKYVHTLDDFLADVCTPAATP
ncbi:Lon protease [anaerobic digester metagenome]